jgi:hypothetical protein
MIEQLRQPIPQAPATDPMQTVIGLMGAMAGMMGQLQGIAKPAGGSAIGQLKEMAEVMAIMNDMRGDSGGGSGDGIADIIKAISPMAGPVLQMAAHAQANQQPAPQRRLPPPAAVSRPVAAPQPVPPVAVRPMPAPAPAAADPFFTAPSNPADFPQPISTVENTGETMIGEMAQIVSAFVSIAENGSDASEAADLFFDETMLNLPDDKYGQLCAFIEKPNAISSMAILNKNVNTHRPWFETALERIKARIAAENLEASNAAGE